MSGNIQHDDQNQVPDSLVEDTQKDSRFHEGQDNSHQANDPSMSALHNPWTKY